MIWLVVVIESLADMLLSLGTIASFEAMDKTSEFHLNSSDIPGLVVGQLDNDKTLECYNVHVGKLCVI